ncbi:hypothetical protein [Corynebacterium efficiens]|uniref:hypothetical protein n=1 Tax=Corynebacterium efficiens TaxID=152794 RepID=UPI000313CD8D|nr:hypothetical protein [Corynebacterium efficiens]
MTVGSAPLPRDPRNPRTGETDSPGPETIEARLQEILSPHPQTLAEEAGILEEAHRLLHDALA